MGMANGMVSIGIKISCMLSKDMSNGDAQVITAKEIPAMLPVLNSCAAINATSARAKVMVHFCWSESYITDANEQPMAEAEMLEERGERSIPITMLSNFAGHMYEKAVLLTAMC